MEIGICGGKSKILKQIDGSMNLLEIQFSGFKMLFTVKPRYKIEINKIYGDN